MAINTKDKQLVDIQLWGYQDLILDSGNDLSMVYGKDSITYCLIRRILVEKGSWKYDPNFGTNLHLLLRERGTMYVSEDEIREEIISAIQPMIEDGRVESLDGVKITDRTNKQLTVEVLVKISSEVTALQLTLQG